MKGRPPKPLALRILQGNPGRKSLSAREPMPTPIVSAPEPPAHLPASAQAKWRQLAPELCRLKILSLLDTDLLEMFCSVYARKREADIFLEKHGTTYGDRFLRPYPQVDISARAATMMLACADRLGLSPSGRARLRIPSEDKPQSAMTARLLSGPEKAS